MNKDSWQATVQSQDELTHETQLEEAPRVRYFEVWCRLKKSSKYYHQGLTDPANSKSKPGLLSSGILSPRTTAARIYAAMATFSTSIATATALRIVSFFLVNPKNPKHFLRIA
jgi:hypothetical protein